MKSVAILSLIAVSAAFVGCPSEQKKPDPAPVVKEEGLASGPEWFENRSGQSPNRIYGYGQSAGEKNPSLARSSARASAQDEVAQFLSTKIQSLFKRYQASTGNGEESRDVRDTQEAIKRVTNQVLNGFNIENTEIKGKYAYARGYIGFDEVKSALRSSSELNKMVKEVRAEANDFFKELDAELAKDMKSGS